MKKYCPHYNEHKIISVVGRDILFMRISWNLNLLLVGFGETLFYVKHLGKQSH